VPLFEWFSANLEKNTGGIAFDPTMTGVDIPMPVGMWLGTGFLNVVG